MVDLIWILKMRVLGGRRRLYEKPVREMLKQIHGETFWDIGANIGYYTKMLEKNFEQIIAVEPVKETRMRLERHFLFSPKVQVLPYALSNFDGEGEIYINEANSENPGIHNIQASSSMLSSFAFKSSENPALDKTYTGKLVKIQVRRFDTLCPKEMVALVKIDVEGAEFEVLEGMDIALREHRILNLLVELHDRDKKEMLEKVLLNYRFNVRWPDPGHVLAQLPIQKLHSIRNVSCE